MMKTLLLAVLVLAILSTASAGVKTCKQCDKLGSAAAKYYQAQASHSGMVGYFQTEVCGNMEKREKGKCKKAVAKSWPKLLKFQFSGERDWFAQYTLCPDLNCSLYEKADENTQVTCNDCVDGMDDVAEKYINDDYIGWHTDRDYCPFVENIHDDFSVKDCRKVMAYYPSLMKSLYDLRTDEATLSFCKSQEFVHCVEE